MMQAYAEYKDSGVDWLGEIPAGWKLNRLKFVTKIVKRIAGEEGPSVLSITQRGIKVKDIASGEGQLAMDYSKYQLVYSGDFAMNHMDLLTGYVDISKFDGVISPDYRVFKNTQEDVDDRYLLHLFQMGYTNRIFYRYGQGVSALGRWRFPADNFNNYLIPIPSLKEQRKIIDFLDDKTAKIDELVGIKRRQIALLGERKQILIQNAVTKGLNPNAPLKDSGIDWIGDIPVHWEVKPLKRVVKEHSGYGFPIELQGEEDGSVPFLKVSDFSSDKLWLDTANNLVSEKTIRNRGWKKVPSGSLVTAKIGEALRKNHRNILATDALIDNNCIAFHPYGMSLLYCFYLHRTIDFDWFVNPGAVPSISVSKYKALKVPVPPEEEQIEVSQFIDEQSNKINAAITIKENQITKLNEYKTTLINAAVTGKIKVA